MTPQKRVVRNTQELREAFEAMQSAVEELSLQLYTPGGRPRRPLAADEFFEHLAEMTHWLRAVLAYCGYGYSLAHLNVLADMWTENHEITEAHLDSLERSVPIPDLQTMAHLMSNVSHILGTREGPEDAETLE